MSISLSLSLSLSLSHTHTHTLSLSIHLYFSFFLDKGVRYYCNIATISAYISHLLQNALKDLTIMKYNSQSLQSLLHPPNPQDYKLQSISIRGNYQEHFKASIIFFLMFSKFCIVIPRIYP